MKRSVAHWQIGGFVFTSVLGTGLHFLFDLTGGNMVAALISAVNESIWEHMKLLFYPMLIFAAIEYRFWCKDTPGFWCVKLKGTLLGLGLIPVLYYTYSGILGVTADWFNITIFFITAACAYFVETRLFLQNKPCRCSDRVCIALFLLIAGLFTLFTFLPPRIPFFRDSPSGTYGFSATP